MLVSGEAMRCIWFLCANCAFFYNLQISLIIALEFVNSMLEVHTILQGDIVYFSQSLPGERDLNPHRIRRSPTGVITPRSGTLEAQPLIDIISKQG